VATELAPVEAEYLPALHCVHAVVEVLYVPAAHSVHTVVPVYPLLHTQAAVLVLPVFEDESVGQAVHVESAVAAVSKFIQSNLKSKFSCDYQDRLSCIFHDRYCCCSC